MRGTEPGTEHVDEGNHLPRQVPRRRVERVERPLPGRPLAQHLAKATRLEIFFAGELGQQGDADSAASGFMYPADVVPDEPSSDVHVDRLASPVQGPHAWARPRPEPDCLVLLELPGPPRATSSAQVSWRGHEDLLHHGKFACNQV